MEMIDTVGYLAAGLVLATFCMRSMGTLRMVAIASNLAFIAYGYVGSLAPGLLLHVLLLPVNIYRLLQLGWPDKSPLAVRARSSTSRRWHRV
jgi:CRP/FNR family cyclic AMP-dependent transcriptional regulator